MQIDTFIAVGENIHCTRIYKVGGKFCRETDGGYAIHYTAGSEACRLPVPDHFIGNADWETGKVKHCAVAVWQGRYGDAAGRAAGRHYLETLARRQEAADAAYLDINVDEFSTDVDERVELMKWVVEVAQGAATIPMSIDSSNMRILTAGLEACDPSRGKPMINSVSLERTEAIDIAAANQAVVIASAAGENSLPNTTEERMANISKLTDMLKAAGLELPDLHIDPLVFPISTDGENGNRFLDTVRAVRETYGPEVHIVAGLSNVSFGMPKRKIINQAYAHLAVQAGADGGIVDPMQINAHILGALDTEAVSYQLAKALLVGKDDYGMNYIMACRNGTL